MKFFEKMQASFMKVFSSFFTDDDCECKRLNMKGKVLLGAIILILAIT